MITVVNKITGEIYELEDSTPEDIKESWLSLSETIKACERAKEKLKPKVSQLLNDKRLYDFGDYQFRESVVQRQNYDKSVMKETLDPDVLDILLIPDKPRIDTYLKENIESLGEVSTKLRKSMISIGNPYTVIRLEKTKRD